MRALFRRRTLLLVALLLMLGCLAMGLLRMVQGERDALVREVARQRLSQVERVAREIEEDFEDIGEDLRVAGQLLTTTSSLVDHERELGALLAVVKQYRMARLYDEQSQPLLQVIDPLAGPSFNPSAFDSALSEVASRALRRPPGRIETSPAIAADPGGWFRAFATSVPRGTGKHQPRVIAVLVDTELFFDKDMRRLRTDVDSRLLLLGAYGRPAPATDPFLTRAVTAIDGGWHAAPRFASMLGEMRAGRSGTAYLGRDEGTALGFGRHRVTGAFAAIRIQGGGHWSVATLTSEQALRSQEQAIALRAGLIFSGTAIILIVGFSLALSASRRAVQIRERLRQADQLAHLHEKTEKILDNIPTGVMALSEDERITALNRALRERIPATAVGAQLSQAFPEAPQQVVRRLRSLIESARLSERVRSLFGRRLSLFGKEGQYSIHAVPLEPRFSEARVLLVIEDLSEIRSLASQLLRAEKLATAGVLAAGIAHEIGTPLSVARGRAEYLFGKLGPGIDHQHADSLKVIIEQIDSVIRMVGQLLDFARIKPATVQKVALLPITQNVTELLRLEIERRRLTVQVDVPAHLPELSADPDQLQQVLVNLVMNACDACEEGGRIHLGASTEEGQGQVSAIRIEVRDDGCGIPEAHRDQVFDPFFTTKKRGQGTGLGLTIAAQIVRNHGGQIEIESEPGKGTCIMLIWPVASRAQEESHAISP